MKTILTFDTSWGRCAVGLRGQRVFALTVPCRSRKQFQRKLAEICGDSTTREAGPRHPIARQVRAYLDGRRANLQLSLDLSGLTDFQRDVLAACARIPSGETCTYAELAAAAGHPGAARAVGNTMARNPIPLAIPCHRVLRSNGSLGGYSAPGGVALKRRLLAHEREMMEQVVIPRSVRSALQLSPGQKMQVMEYDGRIELIPERDITELRGFLKGINTTLEREEDRV